MQSLLGFEMSAATQYVVAFMTIFVLLALFALVLRRVTGGKIVLAGQDRARSRQPRLGLVDTYDLDRQRQLVLVRRDNVEHLIMIGGPNDLLVEGNIVKSQAGVMAQAPVIGRVVSNVLSENELSHNHNPNHTTTPITAMGSASFLQASNSDALHQDDALMQTKSLAQPLTEVSVPQAPLAHLSSDASLSKNTSTPKLEVQPPISSQKAEIRLDKQHLQPTIERSYPQSDASPVEKHILTERNKKAPSDVGANVEMQSSLANSEVHNITAQQNPSKAGGIDISQSKMRQETLNQQPANHELADPALADMARQLEILLKTPTAEHNTDDAPQSRMTSNQDVVKNTVQSASHAASKPSIPPAMPSTPLASTAPAIPKVDQLERYKNTPESSIAEPVRSAQHAKPTTTAPTYRAPINQEIPKVSPPATVQNTVEAGSIIGATPQPAVAIAPERTIITPQYQPREFEKSNQTSGNANAASTSVSGNDTAMNSGGMSETEALEMLSIEAIEAEFARLLGRSAEN